MFMLGHLTRTLAIVACLCLSIIAINAQFARADRGELTLPNETSVNIQELHVSDSDNDLLLPEESTEMIFEDDSSCLYDIPASTDDDEMDEDQVDRCETSDLSPK
jgi:hypothetical protein